MNTQQINEMSEHNAALIKDAVIILSLLTDTNTGRITEALIGIAFSEEEANMIEDSDGDV
jgi:hypothetical protein